MSQLLEIQKHQVPVKKWLEWARNPSCLVFEKPNRKRKYDEDTPQFPPVSRTFRREARNRRDYVAVSYTDQPSEQENSASGGYRIIGSAQGESDTPARVRDCVLERTITYADHHGVNLIWVDDDCLNRDNPEEHEKAIQSMDLIYKFSKYPVGLLTKPIGTQESLDLLFETLHSGLVEPGSIPRLKPGISVIKVGKVIELLHYIITDKWWTRAWIFQENYRSSVKMKLLIPFHHSLSLNKNQRKEWGNIPGELQVSSANFHEQATLFCLGFLDEAGAKWQNNRGKCEEILRRAGRYKVLYKHGHLAGPEFASRAMSPTIFKDIGGREISKASDLLAIAANCCDYSIRLNTKRLSGTSCSLSISILALYLLNGEIIMNREHYESLLSKNIFDYLQLLALNDFDPPVQSQKLTFLKTCRLVDVRLAVDGIETRGMLWKVHKAIETREFSTNPPRESTSPNGLNSYQRSRIRQLSTELRIQGYKPLANDLDQYLQEDAEEYEAPSKLYKDLMAETVVEAIKKREPIYLGCLVGCNPYRGIFIPGPAEERPSYVFTAWSRARNGVKMSDRTRAGKQLDKLISLEVDVTGNPLNHRPQLEMKRGVNGLCFFDGDETSRVVFNYPRSLTK